MLFLGFISLTGHAIQGGEVGAFKQHSLALKAGMSKNELLSKLGKPKTISYLKDDTDVKNLLAAYGYMYFHPDDVMTHLLVGIKDEKITGAVICKEFVVVQEMFQGKVYTSKCFAPEQYWNSNLQSAEISAFDTGSIFCEGISNEEEPFASPKIQCSMHDEKPINIYFQVGKDAPSYLEFKAFNLNQFPNPVIVGIAVESGGSSGHFEWSVIGIVKGTLKELFQKHPQTNSEDRFCLETFQGKKNLGPSLWNFIWEENESHFDDHRYQITLFKWAGNSFQEDTVKETKKKHDSLESAATELGYRCSEKSKELEELIGDYS